MQIVRHPNNQPVHRRHDSNMNYTYVYLNMKMEVFAQHDQTKLVAEVKVGFVVECEEEVSVVMEEHVVEVMVVLEEVKTEV